MTSNLLRGLACAGVMAMCSPVYGALPADYHDGFIAHEVVIPRLDVAPELHTDLSKSPWDKAAMLTGNLDTRRIRTADVPVWTYMFYDRESLWLGYRNEAKSGKSLKTNILERDANLKKDDTLTFELDVGPTGRVFYRFVINSAGNLYDSVIIDQTWNSHAEIKTATDDKGWTVVMRVPFSDFGRTEPPVGTRWTFDAHSRIVIENHWASVLGGYHTPEEFAGLVFGGEKLEPARMLEFKSLRAGENQFRVQAPAGTRYLLETVDQHKKVIARQEAALSADGQVRFPLVDDRAHHVNFTFTNPDGQRILSFWRPAEMPEIMGRLPALQDKLATVHKMSDQFPQGLSGNVDRLLKSFDQFMNKPVGSLFAKWMEQHERLGKLERQINDMWLYAETLDKVSSRASFAVALATPMDQVMIKDFPCPGHAAKQYDLYLARNEHEAMQVVVIPMTGPLTDATVTVSAPKGKSAFNGRVSSALVGHVKTVHAASYNPDYVGWYPEPILPFQQKCDIAQGEHIAFWIDTATSKDTAAGQYESTITVSAAGCEPLEIRLNIHVWDIELPDGTHLKNAFTFAKGRTKQVYKQKWSAEIEQNYYDFILDHRLNIDSLYGRDELDIELLRKGVSRGMNAFNLFYVGKGMSADVMRKLLEERVPPLKEAGLYKHAYLYGFDEVNDEVFPRMRELFGLARELYPDLPRMTTAYDITFGRTTGLRDYVDIWVPLIPRYNMIEAERLRAEGKQMWWYLCVGPRHPYPNWFVESPSIESRLIMGAMSYKYHVDGVLYFLINGWPVGAEPITSGPYTNWWPGSGTTITEGSYANGDGSLFCPGPDGPLSTLRFEGIRDGLEDYEYLYQLAAAIDTVAKKPMSMTRAEFIQRARNLLSIPEQVVESSSRFTGNPAELYKFRHEVARAILEARQLAR